VQALVDASRGNVDPAVVDAAEAAMNDLRGHVGTLEGAESTLRQTIPDQPPPAP
jgi:hypothetical protein